MISLLRDCHASAESLAARRKDLQLTHADNSYLADAVLRKAASEEYSRALSLLAGPGTLTNDTAVRVQELL